MNTVCHIVRDLTILSRNVEEKLFLKLNLMPKENFDMLS